MLIADGRLEICPCVFFYESGSCRPKLALVNVACPRISEICLQARLAMIN